MSKMFKHIFFICIVGNYVFWAFEMDRDGRFFCPKNSKIYKSINISRPIMYKSLQSTQFSLTIYPLPFMRVYIQHLWTRLMFKPDNLIQIFCQKKTSYFLTILSIQIIKMRNISLFTSITTYIKIFKIDFVKDNYTLLSLGFVYGITQINHFLQLNISFDTRIV